MRADVTVPRHRILTVLALGALVAAAAATPPFDAPMRRLANYDSESGAPITTVAVDLAALRRAEAILPADATYYVHTTDLTQGQLLHDLGGVARLFFLPALPAVRAGDARWVLSYRAETRLPPGLRARRTHRVGDGIYLIRVA